MRMRLLFISPVGQLGGAERCLLTMARSIRMMDGEIEIHALVCGEGPLQPCLADIGVIVHSLPLPASLAGLGDSGMRSASRFSALAGLAGRALPAWIDLREYLRRFRSLIEEISPDVIHSNGIKTHLLTGWARPTECPILWHMHDLPGDRALTPRLLRLASRPVAGAIAISRAVAADLTRVLPRVPSHIILNAIDTDHFSPAPADKSLLDRLASMPQAMDDTVRVGLIATYARWKGQDVFIKAAATALKQATHHRLRFHIIGGPIYDTRKSQFSRDELQAQAKMMGIADQIGFIDFQRSTVEINRALDIVVHASTQAEPFGLTIAEAMSCGRAVIISAAGGAKELFTDGVDGMGIRPGDPTQLADAILRLAGDADLRWSLGLNARQTALEKFNMTRYGRELCRLYGRHAGHG